MKRRRFRRLVVIAAALAIVAGACGDDGGSDTKASSTGGTGGTGATASSAANTTTTLTPKVGGTINMGMYSETAGLDPVVSNGGGTTGETELTAIYDTLMRYDPTKKVFEPQMAESLTPNADNTEWILKLRANTKFSDGTDLDGDAVVFSIKRHTQFGSRSAAQVGIVKEYTVVDKQTVKFTLSTPWANFPYMLSYMPGMITSPTAVKAACGPNGETTPRNCKFNLEPIGAGPFKVQKYTPKESIQLVRNDTYWGGKPYLDGVTFKVLSGAPATYDALQTGTLNVGFLREPEIRKKAFEEKKVDFYENFQWMGGVALLNNGKVNCKGGLPAATCAGKPDGVITLDTPTADKRIRQAIAYTLDTAVINQRANNGAGFPGTEMFQKSSKWASASPINNLDTAKAKALVEEVKKEGKWDGSIRLICNNAPSRAAWAQTFQTLLTGVGFNVKLKNDYDINGEVADVLNNKAYDVACWGFNIAEEAPEIALLSAVYSTSAANAMNYVNTDVDAQIQIVRSGKTDAERKAALEKIQDIWRQDMPTPVYEALSEMIAWNKNVHGIKPTVASSVMFDKAWIG
jgi:peptide/nickel transport system substrate-binding protein